MHALLRLVALRYLKAAPGRTLLTLTGILLGVAVIFAIDVVNGTVLASFRATVDDVAGKTALQIGGGDDAGVAEALLEPVRAVDGVALAVPVISENVREVKSGRELAVLAVDTLSDAKVRDYDVGKADVSIEDEMAFLNDPRAVLVTQEFAAKAGVSVGDTLTLETIQGRQDFTVRGTLAARGPARVFGGDLLLMDVYAAQIAFGREKRFDRIDVVPVRGADLEELTGRLEKVLAGRAPVTRPVRRTQEAERMLAGFRLGLSLASLVAIFVGGFIVYNALAIAVAQRRREIGILRALGATRRAILLLFVGEGMILGLIGSVLGLFAGLLLARVVLSTVGRTISDLYLRVKPSGLAITPLQLMIGLSAGLLASLVAAFFPARTAAWIEPASAMRKRVEAADTSLSGVRRSFTFGVATLVVAVGIAGVAHARQDFLMGYAVAGVLSFAVAFLSPALARSLGALARPLSTRVGPVARLAADSFDRNVGRNAVTIAALGMALSNVLLVAAFLGSTKTTMQGWFERSIRADIFAFAGREVKAKFEHPLPESIGQEIRALPEVTTVTDLRMTRHTFRGEPYWLLSWELPEYLKHNQIPVVDGEVATDLPEIEAGKGVAASETFAHLFGVRRGDTVELDTPEGPRSFRISFIYVDYTADIGILTTTREVYTRLWKDRLVDSFGIYVTPGADPAALRARIAESWGRRYGLMVLQNADYQRQIMTLIDRSFTLTKAMEAVALLVAVLGIVNALLVGVIDRKMEIGILKAIGASGAQVMAMFVVEAALIGLAATVLGVALGGAFSVYIVKELLRFQVGWRMGYVFPARQALDLLLLAQVVAWMGASWPAWRAARLDVVDALEYE